MKIKKALGAIMYFIASFSIFLSCSDNDNKVPEYNPNQAITLTSFFPDSGGIKTQIILQGDNFGSDTSKIKVFFNQKEAAVVSAKGNMMYALVPRLPGDTCIISVQIGDNVVAYPDTFFYKTQFMLSTVAGTRGVEDKFVGGSLATATLGHINGVAVDDNNNIFAAMNQGAARISVEEFIASWLSGEIPGRGKCNAPFVHPITQIVYIPSDAQDTFLELNPVTLWVPRIRRIIKPSAEEIAQGKKDWEGALAWKHSFAYCEYDGYMYVRSHSGAIIRFDETTYKGELVMFDPITNSDSYLAFDPLDPKMLYISYSASSDIHRINLETKTQELVAGSEPQGGWRDGPGKDAEFRNVRQICFDKDGMLYVADCNNHCIRQINREGIVSTIAGMATKSGYKDGAPDEALLDQPWGVAVDKEGNIYIGEQGNNRMIRKLTLE